MGINSATLKFKTDLLSLINNSGLPICNVEMVISNVLSAVQIKLNEAIEIEKKEEVQTSD
jgi:hypothetical protein